MQEIDRQGLTSGKTLRLDQNHMNYINEIMMKFEKYRSTRLTEAETLRLILDVFCHKYINDKKQTLMLLEFYSARFNGK